MQTKQLDSTPTPAAVADLAQLLRDDLRNAFSDPEAVGLGFMFSPDELVTATYALYETGEATLAQVVSRVNGFLWPRATRAATALHGHHGDGWTETYINDMMATLESAAPRLAEIRRLGWEPWDALAQEGHRQDREEQAEREARVSRGMACRTWTDGPIANPL